MGMSVDKSGWKPRAAAPCSSSSLNTRRSTWAWPFLSTTASEEGDHQAASATVLGTGGVFCVDGVDWDQVLRNVLMWA
jgi:hypothetical protein